ncbi:GtrA family protein [Ottowia caeni]|uniref:GtrA family protein n=1 Tax=Ottowia caeni TaxID=2870339 RepID=UPI001E5060BA|nr:GtrA family protein [Ottowia caeni]
MNLRSTFARYLLAGATNTVASYLLYLALLQVSGYRVAYVASFVAGIALSYVLMRFAVFQSPGRRFSSLWVAASHLMQLALGLAVVELWVMWLQGPTELAALAAVAVCVPLMFLVQRWIFMSSGRGGRSREDEGSGRSQSSGSGR